MVQPHLGVRGIDCGMIVWDERNPRAVEFHRELSERLDDSAHSDVVIVLGGDGFMLQAVAQNGRGLPYLGLNAGHLGFLHNEVDADWDEIAARIADKRYRPVKFPLLRARIRTLLERLGEGADRPLLRDLSASGRRERLDALLRERGRFYETAPVIVDVDGRGPDFAALHAARGLEARAQS